MIALGWLAYACLDAAVAWMERDYFVEHDARGVRRVDGWAALFVLAVLWPGVLALKALRWWRRR